MSKTETSAIIRADDVTSSSQVAWFCLRSQPRHEHIAARHLSQMADVEVFNPRIQYARPTRNGAIWMTESLFPNYLFARFDWNTSLNKVHYAPGISGIVHFGDKWPTIPDAAIEELKISLGRKEIHIIQQVAPGDVVEIAGGTFHSLKALVTQVIPGKERVVVLMDFLGRQTTVEMGLNSVVKCGLGR
jgi:transcriptional antiterminator RfaH